MIADLLEGDCREILPKLGPFDMILADAPYKETSLIWDRPGRGSVAGWLQVAAAALKPTGSMWAFGSMRYFMAEAVRIREAGFVQAQNIVWEKHNGSNFLADRFRRVHEHAVQFYLESAGWGGVYNVPAMTHDAVARTVTRNKSRPTHLGKHGASTYRSEDGGPKLMRSVIRMRSCHGTAIHPTEKPVGLLDLLIRTSCPEGGLVADFFAGSAAGGVAARAAGRHYVGCEKDPTMVILARRRLQGTLI